MHKISIKFLGAIKEVTGSCHLLTVGPYKILLDCGLIQGGYKDEVRNSEPLSFDSASLTAIVLSHAHLDHSGRLPLITKQGFNGRIYAHTATYDLCRIMLRDSAKLQQKDAEITNRKRARKGLPPIPPLYEVEDVDMTEPLFAPCEYHQWQTINEQIRFRFHDAGHILGSCIVELELQDHGVVRRLIFSGDLGPYQAPILRDPESGFDADHVIMESTYGDRDHRSFDDTLYELEAIFNSESSSRGNIIIPAFAVGRAQELLYLFAKHRQRWHLERWQIFLDSPMAISATEVYLKHHCLYDAEARATFGERPAQKLKQLLPNLTFCETPEESMAINRIHHGAIIIAGSGMCTGGRVKHHLKHLVWRDTTQVVIVGFQAHGTPGRALVDGNHFIRLWGEAIKVRAKVHTIGGLSAHAGQTDLLRWYQHMPKRPAVTLVHGEEQAQETLKAKMREQFPGLSVRRAVDVELLAL